MSQKILAIGAHPDDIEFGVGAIIIKAIAQGATVKYLVCSLGEAGSNGTPQGRKQEAISAAKFVGADIEFLNMGGDCHIEPNPENTIQIAKFIRKFQPDMVLTPSLIENQHPDHLAVAQMTRNACRLARYGGLKELKTLKTHHIQALLFYPSSAEFDKRPDIIIDVSHEHQRWVKAMHHHKSQMKTKAYEHLVSSKAQYFGSTIGTKFAIGLWVNDPVRINNLSDLKLSSRNY